MMERKSEEWLEWIRRGEDLAGRISYEPPSLSSLLPLLSKRTRTAAVRSAGGTKLARRVRLTYHGCDMAGVVLKFQMHKRSGLYSNDYFFIIGLVNSTEEDGKRKIYWLRSVPLAAHGRPISSVAWSFGRGRHEYAPERQT